jgi:hypothetical protein
VRVAEAAGAGVRVAVAAAVGLALAVAVGFLVETGGRLAVAPTARAAEGVEVVLSSTVGAGVHAERI